MSEEHHDVHPASHYWKIFWILCALFAVSVAGPEIAKVLNTHRFPLDAAAEAFAFAGSDSESLKVVIEP